MKIIKYIKLALTICSVIIMDTGYANTTNEIAQLTQKADQGDAAAQYSLGMFYLKGEGVPKDLPKAKKYFQQACSNKNQNGCKMYNTLTK